MNWLFGKITDISDEEYRQIYACLSDSRRAHIDKMKKADDKKRSLLATLLVKRLLDSAGVNAQLLTNENGRPFLNTESLHISISHSFEAVACVLSHSPVGIDVEKIKPVSRKLARFVCTERELAFVLSDDDGGSDEMLSLEAAERFFAVWTAKEAFYKKSSADQKDFRSIETLSLPKKVFLKENYFITIV